MKLDLTNVNLRKSVKLTAEEAMKVFPELFYEDEDMLALLDMLPERVLNDDYNLMEKRFRAVTDKLGELMFKKFIELTCIEEGDWDDIWRKIKKDEFIQPDKIPAHDCVTYTAEVIHTGELSEEEVNANVAAFLYRRYHPKRHDFPEFVEEDKRKGLI